MKKKLLLVAIFTFFIISFTSYSETGYDSNGFNEKGIHKDTGTYHDENGIDSKGWVKDNESGLFWNVSTEDTYDIEGYNYEGYNIEGYDREGFNKDGADRDGFFTKGAPKINNWYAIEHSDDFNGRTGKYLIVQKILSSNVSAIMIDKDKNTYNLFITFDESIFNLYKDAKVSIKDSNNKIITITGISLGEGISFLNQSEILKFLDLLKKQTSVKVSIVVSGDKYIFDIDCKGFTEISKKYLK